MAIKSTEKINFDIFDLTALFVWQITIYGTLILVLLTYFT